MHVRPEGPLRYAAVLDNEAILRVHLQQVRSEFRSRSPDSHSVIKPVRVPFTRVLHYVSNKFEVSTALRLE